MVFGITPAEVKVFANAGPRIEHRDPTGTTVQRVFYCEPYVSYPYCELFLKGTVIDTGDGTFARVKPHQDPILPHCFCSDVKVVPFANETITGMPVSLFTPSTDFSINVNGSATGQQAQIYNVLNCVDDHSYGNIIDFQAQEGISPPPPLTIAQVKAGGIQYPNDGSSQGKCGAYLIATYTELIFLDGIPLSGEHAVDPFDYVLPKWKPIEINTQTGRNLFFYSPVRAGHMDANGGLTDTFARPEVVWEFSITRLMVPFIPHLTYGALNNKINSSLNQTLGNMTIPTGTARFVCPELSEPILCPDSTLTTPKSYYNITLKYMIRKIWDEYFDPDTFLAATVGHSGLAPKGAGTLKGWIDWNHHYGIPSARTWPNLPIDPAGYYPVCWNGGVFQYFGENHPLYLQDQELTGSDAAPGVIAWDLFYTEFNVGFKAGQ